MCASAEHRLKCREMEFINYFEYVPKTRSLIKEINRTCVLKSPYAYVWVTAPRKNHIRKRSDKNMPCERCALIRGDNNIVLCVTINAPES